MQSCIFFAKYFYLDRSRLRNNLISKPIEPYMAPGKWMKEPESPKRGLVSVSDMTVQTPQEKGSHRQIIYGCLLLHYNKLARKA